MHVVKHIKVAYFSILNDVIKEFSTGDIFHHHEDICWGAYHLVSANIHHTIFKLREKITQKSSDSTTYLDISVYNSFKTRK